MENYFADIYNELLTELDSEEQPIDEKKLHSKLNSAIREIAEERAYPYNYTEDMIIADLRKYASNIKRLTMWDYTHIGGEDQLTHAENNISRTWASRESCFRGVCRISVCF